MHDASMGSTSQVDKRVHTVHVRVHYIKYLLLQTRSRAHIYMHVLLTRQLSWQDRL